MMKKIITILVGMLLIIPLAIAEDVIAPIGTADIDIEIHTDQNIDANIVEIADGDVTTNVYCSAGGDCNTNLYGGSVSSEEDINLNQYITNNEYGGSSGLSMSGLVDRMARKVGDYIAGKEPRYSGGAAWDLWSLLDVVFVSHKEYTPTFNNMMYLGEEVDRLNAENAMLKIVMQEHLNLTLNPDTLECWTGINKAKRTGTDMLVENGWIIDINNFGETCVKLQTINTTTNTNQTNSTG